jgi:proline-specific peptidase
VQVRPLGRRRRTAARTAGELGSQIPVLLLHGGPGVPHQSLEALEAFAASGRPLVFYDQLGCGFSDRPDDPELGSLELFLDELAAVRGALGLDEVHLLGHSWGGLLAMEYAVRQPAGLQSLILVGAPACRSTMWDKQQRLQEQLPAEVLDTLRRHQAAGTLADAEFWAAWRVWEQRHVYRPQPWPGFLERAYAGMNLALLQRMWSTQLVGWDIRPRLGGIGVPTLIIAGRFDGQVPPDEAVFLHQGIHGSQLAIFDASSHHPHAEEPERFEAELQAFLTHVERSVGTLSPDASCARRSGEPGG